MAASFYSAKLCNISKHFSISVLFFHNFYLMFCVFCRIFETSRAGGGFRTLFVPGGGEFALSKILRGLPGEGVREIVRLEID